MLVLISPTPEGWKAECTLAGKKITQIFNHRPGRRSNRGPQAWEAEILPLRQPLPYQLTLDVPSSPPPPPKKNSASAAAVVLGDIFPKKSFLFPKYVIHLIQERVYR